VAVVLFLTATAFAGGAAIADRWTLHCQPTRLVNGSPVLLRVTVPKPLRTLTGKWLGHDIAFNSEASQKVWSALAGASLETKPGTYPIQLRGETSTGQIITYEQGIRVLHQRYPRVMLKVPGRYTAPNPEEQRQIARDKEVKARAFQTVSPDREWKGSFVAPVKAPISDVFGVQRVFNGSVQSTHQGLDFRVPDGTPVAAVNNGTVLLAGPLFFEGTCIVLDHGQGVLTIYMHLSKVEVKEGQPVKKGEQLGLSGASGRATGPHLHLAVRWQGVYLNPDVLLRLRLP
jgi:murein DD-endopeptidase MepM/ murein hydrolase activator NlpD